MKIVNTSKVLFASVLLTAAGSASATIGSSPSTYGILPHDVATVQSMSLFTTEASAAYFNPAALASEPQGTLTSGLFHAATDLKAKTIGGPAPLNRSNDTLDATPSQLVIIGITTNASETTTFKHPLKLGFVLAAEKFSKEVMAFTAQTSDEGQFMQYDREPLFMVLGFGTQLWRGIDIGASLRINLQASADLELTSDLAGNTSNEKLSVSAKLAFSPILGININVGDTFCPRFEHCWLEKIDVAMSHREASYARTTVNANVTIPQTIASPGLALALSGYDAFQPAITTAGIRYNHGKLNLGATIEFQDWQLIDDKLQEDTVHDQANIQFDNIVIPRVGIEYAYADNITLKGGFAFEPSPLDTNKTPGINYLDGDKIIFGLGASMVIQDSWYVFMRTPLQLDFGYQFHSISSQDFDLYTSDDPDTSYETVSASGTVHVFVASFTMKF